MKTPQARRVQDAVLHDPCRDVYANRPPPPPERPALRARVALAELRLREGDPAAAHAILISVLDWD